MEDESSSFKSRRERAARKLAKWLAERDGVHSDGDFKLNPKYEAYLTEGEELVDSLLSFGFLLK